MSTMIEEIRKRIKAASDNTDEAGDYDEYGSGQSVGLATALQIIDEVVKEHPIPADVQEAAEKYGRDTFINECMENGSCDANDLADAFKAGAAWARERLASCPSFKGWVARDKCGELYFFAERPTRGATMWNAEGFCAYMPFPQRNLPSIRWEDEPKEVEIIIKEAKK